MEWDRFEAYTAALGRVLKAENSKQGKGRRG